MSDDIEARLTALEKSDLLQDITIGVLYERVTGQRVPWLDKKLALLPPDDAALILQHLPEANRPPL